MRAKAQFSSRTLAQRGISMPSRIWLVAAGLGAFYGSFLAVPFRHGFSVVYGAMFSAVPLISTWMIGGALAGFIAGRLPRPAGWSLAALLIVSLFGLRTGLIGFGFFPFGFGVVMGLCLGRSGAKTVTPQTLRTNRAGSGNKGGVTRWQSELAPLFQPLVTVFSLSGLIVLAALQVAPALAATEYYYGDGKGVNCSLRLARKGVFAFLWTGCTGTYGENEGVYHFDNNRLVLDPSDPNMQEGFMGSSTHFFPVDWGGRSYLIPEEKMLDFCNEINQGREPRQWMQGFFLFAHRRPRKPAVGFPSLPQPWREHLLAKPVHGLVVAVDSKGFATVDVGRRHGIKPGMVFITMPSDGHCAYLQVISIEQATSKTKLDPVFSEGKARMGDKVTTRFPE